MGSKAFGGLNRRLKEKTAESRWFETTGQAPFGRAKAAYWGINFCYTPKHGSWLHVAACALSCFTSQCLSDHRIGALPVLQTEIAAWSDKTNNKQRGVDWPFRIENARVKLKRLYPKMKA